MPIPRFVASALPLTIGLAVGIVGATMFMESIPAAGGTPQARSQKLEAELLRAQQRIASLEASQSASHTQSGISEGNGRHSRFFGGRDNTSGAVNESARRVVEDAKEGRLISPEDVLRAFQPAIKTLSPLFNRVRVKQQQQAIDSMTGELARKYNLSARNQDALNQWFRQKADDEAKRWTELVSREGSTLEDVIRASRDLRPFDGLDAFMPTILQGDQVAKYTSERMAERAVRVEQEADMRVSRLNSIVPLDEAQQAQVFGIMARGSRDYDPSMKLQAGDDPIPATPVGDRQAAVMAVLRPDQKAAYLQEQAKRRDVAAREAESIGLLLPANWSLFDEEFFGR